jgi:hypothetical protein
MKDFSIGTRGRIINECFITSEVEETADGSLTANEHWREAGEFVVIGVKEEFILVVFDGEAYEWWIDSYEFENVEII